MTVGHRPANGHRGHSRDNGHGDPPCSVVVGTPAKVIKPFEEEAIAARLDQAQHYYRLAMNNKKSLPPQVAGKTQ